MEALLLAFRAACGALLENGTVVQILKLMGWNGQGPLAVVVEQENPGRQIFEIDLIADGFQAVILQKIKSPGPLKRTFGALFEHVKSL
jgi:hypothetical protein